jgi:hypothetical protein
MFQVEARLGRMRKQEILASVETFQTMNESIQNAIPRLPVFRSLIS